MEIFLTYFSNLVIPSIIFYIVAYGVTAKCNVYEEFIKGAKDGFGVVVKIAPTLVALLVGVGVLRSSGLMEDMGTLLTDLTGAAIPAQLYSLIGVKMFSASAATGLLLDIYKTFGTDSYIGMAASIICSSTETVFYTMSLYFISIKVTKTRYTLSGALISTIVGIIAGFILANYT